MALSSTGADCKRHCRPSINPNQPSRSSLGGDFLCSRPGTPVLFQRRVTPGPVITSRNCLPPGETIRPATHVLSYRQGSVGLSLRVHHFLSRLPTRSTRSIRTMRPPRPVRSTTDLHHLHKTRHCCSVQTTRDAGVARVTSLLPPAKSN